MQITNITNNKIKDNKMINKQSQIRRTSSIILNPLQKNMYQLFGKNYTSDDALFKEYYEAKHELENTLNKLTIRELIDLKEALRFAYKLKIREGQTLQNKRWQQDLLNHKITN